MHAITAQGRIEPVMPKPFSPSSVSTSTNTNIRLSIDLPIFGRSISWRCSEAEIFPIFIHVLRSERKVLPLRDPDRRPLSYMMAIDGRTLEERTVNDEEGADWTDCRGVRNRYPAGAGSPGRRPRTWRAGGEIPHAAAVRCVQADAAAHCDCDEDRAERSGDRSEGV